MLLPVYITTYAYKEQTFEVLISASGALKPKPPAVVGKRPKLGLGALGRYPKAAYDLLYQYWPASLSLNSTTTPTPAGEIPISASPRTGDVPTTTAAPMVNDELAVAAAEATLVVPVTAVEVVIPVVPTVIAVETPADVVGTTAD